MTQSDVSPSQPAARLSLFGFRPAPAEVEVVERPRAWRVQRAVGSLLAAWLIAPVAFLIPPHVPWALLAFGAGVYLFFKFWTEERTVVRFAGACPKCKEALSLGVPTKLRVPHPMSCERCSQDLLLEVDER